MLPDIDDGCTELARLAVGVKHLLGADADERRAAIDERLVDRGQCRPLGCGEPGAERRMVQDHHDFPGEQSAEDHDGDCVELDLVGRKEELLERQDDAETEEEIEGGEAYFPDLVLRLGEQTHGRSCSAAVPSPALRRSNPSRLSIVSNQISGRSLASSITATSFRKSSERK